MCNGRSDDAQEPTLATVFPDPTEDLRAFLKHGLILDPWLAGLSDEHFEYSSQDLIHAAADALTGQYWREPLVGAAFGTFPIPKRMARTAVHEILTSSAAAIAHECRGRVHVAPDIAAEAIRRVQAFLAERGFGQLVWVYTAATFAENHGAVRHYGAIAEEQFISAALHRPWVRYGLDDELLAGLCLRTYQLSLRDGRRYIVHTPEGEQHFQRIRKMMEVSGYLEQRLRLIVLSQFNLFDKWDDAVTKLFPNALEQRQDFTAFAKVPVGGKVLECGCGMGTQTFEGGIWRAVGPCGMVVGLDPSFGMIERAREKRAGFAVQNVEFVHGRAESIPFSDHEFDAAVGAAFLHFTDAPRALSEMRRVTRPGGTIESVAVWSELHRSGPGERQLLHQRERHPQRHFRLKTSHKRGTAFTCGTPLCQYARDGWGYQCC